MGSSAAEISIILLFYLCIENILMDFNEKNYRIAPWSHYSVNGISPFLQHLGILKIYLFRITYFC